MFIESFPPAISLVYFSQPQITISYVKLQLCQHFKAVNPPPTHNQRHPNRQTMLTSSYFSLTSNFTIPGHFYQHYPSGIQGQYFNFSNKMFIDFYLNLFCFKQQSVLKWQSYQSNNHRHLRVTAQNSKVQPIFPSYTRNPLKLRFRATCGNVTLKRKKKIPHCRADFRGSFAGTANFAHNFCQFLVGGIAAKGAH